MKAVFGEPLPEFGLAVTAMADKIKSGAMLIEGKALLPVSLMLESERCSEGWIWLKNLDRYRLARKVRDRGWNFFSIRGEVKARAFGLDVEKTTRRALARVLADPKSAAFNCLEITEVVLLRFLGLPYVSISARPRHIQESNVLFQSKLAQSELAAA